LARATTGITRSRARRCQIRRSSTNYLAPVDDKYWTQRVVPAIPAGGKSVTVGDSAPTGDRWNLVVVEILAR